MKGGEGGDDVGNEGASSAERVGDGDDLDGRIWGLALPAVASLLLDPVLGAVDTAFVGRIEGEGAAAALGGLAIATTVFNFSFKVFNFLAVVTGPLVATQIAAAQRAEAEAENETGAWGSLDDDAAARPGRGAAAETVAGAMTLAVVLGVSAFAALEIGSDQIIGWAGGDAADAVTSGGPSLTSEAEAYLRVRALSAPAALVGTVAVGAYRGLLDTRTPLVVSGLTNVVNLALDPILIFGLGPVPAFGVAGAAAATTAAEWASAVVFWVLLTREGLLPPGGNIFASLLPSSSSTAGAGDGEASDSTDESAPAQPPSGVSEWAQKLKPLAAGSASQLARTLLLQAVLVRATAEAAGVDAAGAHQICIQVWWVTLFALDALAVAAQSLVAAALGSGDVATARRAADRTLKWALAAGTAVGVGIAASGPLLPALFTTDAETAAAAEGPLRLVAALQPLNAAIFVGDGVLQGAADFDYLAMAMAAAAAPALGSLAMTGGAAAGSGLGVVWRSMALLQIGRATTLAARYWGKDGPVSLPSDGGVTSSEGEEKGPDAAQ